MMDFLNIHTHDARQVEGVQSILSLSVGHDDLLPIESQPVALGVHPWFIRPDQIAEDLASVAELSNSAMVKMIGECGLDKVKGGDFELQIEVFAAQMRVAKRLKKPMVLHVVRAYDELLSISKEVDPQVGMVVHGFNKSEQLGKQLIDHGFTLSFGKVLLNEHSGAAALLAYHDHFLLETDDSDSSIEEIYEVAAKIKKISVDDLKALIFANWKNLNLI